MRKGAVPKESRYLANRNLLFKAIPLTISMFLLLPANSWAETVRPSFDCANAKSLAEKDICADPALAEADVSIASGFAAALKVLDAKAQKTLKEDQQYFIQTRDKIAEFNDGVAKDKQNFDLGETMRDRATLLKSIRAAKSGFIGTWKNLEGSVDIKTSGKNKVEIGGQIANPTSGNNCEIGGTTKIGKQLKLIDTDENDKPTGFTFSFSRSGDQLIVSQSGVGKDGSNQPPDCGANTHFDGSFFMTATPP